MSSVFPVLQAVLDVWDAQQVHGLQASAHIAFTAKRMSPKI